jgi:hypothetical protein
MNKEVESSQKQKTKLEAQREGDSSRSRSVPISFVGGIVVAAEAQPKKFKYELHSPRCPSSKPTAYLANAKTPRALAVSSPTQHESSLRPPRAPARRCTPDTSPLRRPRPSPLILRSPPALHFHCRRAAHPNPKAAETRRFLVPGPCHGHLAGRYSDRWGPSTR